MMGTDYYDYKEWVEKAGYTDINAIPFYYEHYEKPYYVIINMVQNNYFLFRLVVWGGSLLLYWQTAKRLELDKSTFVFYLCICIVQLTAISRVCLAYALAFYGFSFIVKPIRRRKLISYVMGTCVILFSLLFHRSAIFLLAVLPISLFNINKKTIIIIALALPFIVVAMNTDLFDFLLNFDQTEDSLLDSNTAVSYLGTDKQRVVGVAQMIEFFMKYGSHVVLTILIVKSILNRSYTRWPVHMQKYANATLFIVVLASALLFTPGAATYKTFERLIGFAYVPQSYWLAYILKLDNEKKMIKLFNMLMVGYVIYGTLYYNFYFAITDF